MHLGALPCQGYVQTLYMTGDDLLTMVPEWRKTVAEHVEPPHWPNARSRSGDAGPRRGPNYYIRRGIGQAVPF